MDIHFFASPLILTDANLREELQHVGDVKIKIRTREITDIILLEKPYVNNKRIY